MSFVVVAHQDDWQLFMATDVFARLREPQCRLVVVITTAGNGRHEPFHWKSRLSGAVLSLCRALPSWSPYALDGAEPALPASFGVNYDLNFYNGKSVLRCDIRSGAGAHVTMYLLHIAEPLWALCESDEAPVLWPQGAASYRGWNDFVETLECILVSESADASAPAIVRTSDTNETSNGGDHRAHIMTARAVEEICERRPQFRVRGYAMYANQHKPENLDGAQAGDQRCALYAYGGGYMATAAGLAENWPVSWEREYPVFKRREYPRLDGG